MNRYLFWASLLALVVLGGCSASPTVDRAGATLVEGARQSDQPPAPTQPDALNARLKWTLQFAPLNGADARGLQLASDAQRLYLAMPNGMVTAFYREEQPTWTDQVAWQLLLDGPVLGGPLFHEGTLYVGTADGQVVAVDARTGKVVWTRQLSSSVDAPLVLADGKLLARTLDSTLYALRMRDGSVIWKVGHEAPALALQGESAPVVWQDRVIVGWENGVVEALSLQTGAALWRQRVATPKGRTDLARMVDVQAQPVIHDGRLYVVAFHGKLAAMSPDTGTLSWVKDFSSYRDMAVLADRLLAVDDEDALHAFDLITGTRIWRQPQLRYRQLTDLRLWAPTGEVITGDRGGFVHWIEPLTGEVRVRFRHHSAPVVQLFPLAHDQLVVVDGEGYLSLYEIEMRHE